jgi:hypothetical protein
VTRSRHCPINPDVLVTGFVGDERPRCGHRRRARPARSPRTSSRSR